MRSTFDTWHFNFKLTSIQTGLILLITSKQRLLPDLINCLWLFYQRIHKSCFILSFDNNFVANRFICTCKLLVLKIMFYGRWSHFVVLFATFRLQFLTANLHQTMRSKSCLLVMILHNSRKNATRKLRKGNEIMRRTAHNCTSSKKAKMSF